MDVAELLREHERKDLLRFVTAGSVDDGKSTLIGRLLYESKGIYEDQLSSIRSLSARGAGGGPHNGDEGDGAEALDLSLVTDGLKAEREQGITIDVAYRYFSTPRRKFIIADTPGHEQYTRNMATGASTASLIVILIDATKGVVTQSKRHAFIASLLGIYYVRNVKLGDGTRLETLLQVITNGVIIATVATMAFAAFCVFKLFDAVTGGKLLGALSVGLIAGIIVGALLGVGIAMVFRVL